MSNRIQEVVINKLTDQRGYNLHHLIFEEEVAAEVGLIAGRDLPCMQVGSCMAVHSLWHRLRVIPDLRDPLVAAVIRALVKRHENQECSCYGRAKVAVNALTNELLSDGHRLPTWLEWRLDPAAREFIELHIALKPGIRVGRKALRDLGDLHRRCRCCKGR